MIDPYASEEPNAIDLDLSHKKQRTKKWAKKWIRDNTYTVNKIGHLTVDNNVTLYNSKLYNLPDNITVNGNMFIESVNFKKLPNNLTVNGCFSISNTQVNEIPEDLIVTGDFNASDTDISTVPLNHNLKASVYLSNSRLNI